MSASALISMTLIIRRGKAVGRTVQLTELAVQYDVIGLDWRDVIPQLMKMQHRLVL